MNELKWRADRNQEHPMSSMNYQQYIEITPGKRSGKPCLKQTRITVYDVLGWLAQGMTTEEIIAEYPELTAEQIQACLAYAADREHHSLTITAA
jgi:uncharacterized protein (DUF433 family)